jgi:hypothetical protein
MRSLPAGFLLRAYSHVFPFSNRPDVPQPAGFRRGFAIIGETRRVCMRRIINESCCRKEFALAAPRGRLECTSLRSIRWKLSVRTESRNLQTPGPRIGDECSGNERSLDAARDDDGVVASSGGRDCGEREVPFDYARGRLSTAVGMTVACPDVGTRSFVAIYNAAQEDNPFDHENDLPRWETSWSVRIWPGG